MGMSYKGNASSLGKEMKKLDVLARKYFSEFGFMTCTREEMEFILDKYIENEKSN